MNPRHLVLEGDTGAVTTPDTALAAGQAEPADCWCCGQPTPADRRVHLGAHTEAWVCPRCAHSLSKRAWELEDRDKTTPAARARDAVRALRKTVVRHGWHQNRFVGRYLRWLGKHTP